MKQHKNITLWNSFSSLLLQFVTIFSGFVIPRLILNSFGSEVNGLISSLNQFLNYVTLLEGGLSSVIISALYKPLYERNYDKVSSIVKTAQRFYGKLAFYFCIYSFILAIGYPILFSTSFSFSYIFSLTIILSIQIFVQYNFSIAWKLLLNADKKVYIVSFVQILVIILNTVLFAILIRFFSNIHFLKLVSASVFVLQSVFYYFIIQKKYFIDRKAKVDSSLLKSRWDGFGISIATFIHKNTDVAILTIFTNLSTVSVYSVYFLVANGLRSVVTSISAGIIPTLGQLYVKDNKNELNQMFSFYEFIIYFLTFLLFTVGVLLVTPFVLLYTKNITDINYNAPVFGIILLLSEAVFCLKEPFVNLAYAAGTFKDIKKHAYIEAFINIFLSIILVKAYGLIGIAIGTFVAMTYRTIYHVIYLKNHILNRPLSYFIKKFIVFGTTTAICVFFICLCPFQNLSFTHWLIRAVIYSFVIGVVYFIISFVFWKQEVQYILSFVRGIFQKKM